MTRNIVSDVLVVGGGAAAARAAIEADMAGAKVAVAVKGGFGRVSGLRGSGATGCSGGLLGFSDTPHVIDGRRIVSKPEEEPAALLDYMLILGLGMADRKLMKGVIEDIPRAKEGLKKWGLVVEDMAPFMRCFITPMPGLANVVRSKGRIQIVEDTMAVDLIIQDGACRGAVCIHEKSGGVVLLKAKAVILATGGAAQLYMHNCHPSCVTGDGYAMGYAAGAELMNMEYQQIIWATVYPTVNILPAIWQAHPRVLNGNGEEFMARYLPQGVALVDVQNAKLRHWPFSTRDISKYLDISAVKEANAGRANEHHAFLIATDDFKASWGKKIVPQSRDWLQFRGIDWEKEFLEANVAYHCHNGGLRIDENGETSISGLHAVGETAAGPFGADRLAGSMMASSQVLAMRAGWHAAVMSGTKRGPATADTAQLDETINRIDRLKNLRGAVTPGALIKRLQLAAWENMLVVRSETSLIRMLEEIEHIRNEITAGLAIVNTTDLVRALELQNLLQVGEIIARTARMRTESRGNHYRDDYPERDDANWLHSVTVGKVADKMTLGTCARDPEWRSDTGDIGELSWG